jgi:Raf kinase inhibitor-like YbhB/YbcL family protein
MLKKWTFIFATFFLGIIFGENAMAFQLSSNAFKQGETIPQQYTCDGLNISPELIWKDAPEGTKSFVLVMEDPDAPAGIWDHWIVFNIPANVTQLAENVKQLPEGALDGANSWNKTGYGGPCPPDREHRYFFKLYALNVLLPFDASVPKQQILNMMKRHILATAELEGRYQRVK